MSHSAGTISAASALAGAVEPTQRSTPISADEAERLATLLRYAILDTPPEQAYDDVTSLASHICATPFATVTFVDQDRQWFKSEVGFGARYTARAGGFCAQTLLQPTVLIVEDTLLDERFACNPFVLGEPRIRFYAGAPLIAPNGHILGTVCVFDTQPRLLHPQQANALAALSRQVMAQLELRLKIVENERTAAALRTAEKLAVVGRLASSIAHEINNPLQSVTNLLFMAAHGQGHEVSSYLDQAQEELVRVTHIVTQTLRFHRQSSKPAPAHLGELVDSVLRLFRTRLQHASTSITVEDQQTRSLLCYDADLRQVVANLVGNAIDALNEHGGHGRIRIRIRNAADPRTGEAGVRLTVADTGGGMDASIRLRLFEPFFSTKGARGTGLGLWVSKGILANHGANLRVKSAPGRGTVFAIFLPHDPGCHPGE